MDFGLVKKEISKIGKGEYVVLASSDGNWCLGKASSGEQARIGRKGRKVNLGALIGTPWGGMFEVDGRELVACEESMTDAAMNELESELVAENGGTNSNGEPERGQLLTHEEIEDLKAAGSKPEELVQMLAQGNTAFDAKTKFAKQKYLQRKNKQYRFRVKAKKPTARTVCHAYFLKSPEKVMHIRYDVLSLMLNYADIRACTQVTVVDNCNGLILGAAAERLGGFGRILNFFPGRCPAGVDGTRWFNFSEAENRSMIHVPFRFLDRIDQVEADDDEPLTYYNTESGEKEVDDGLPADEELSAEGLQGRKRRRLELRNKRPKNAQLKRWLKDGSDSLLIASRENSLENLSKLLPLLRPSASFAIYNPFLQPLSEIQYALSQTNTASRVQLSEVSILHHQVLEGRTHPVMRDSFGSTGGYVLSGIRIDPHNK
mmetsp:Transcript_32926/g.129241  ORF Transcript_32926/g.129241 Transcript_32926/m.129241 type:complete len:431 (+) Transcript_32926:942-2234(+)|eukprot:CAMPEP_0113961004 /NCGR_PEP_ID=MMETSP0011_2-20120614/5050_1 /TAXON_ID=101924 /ORGANISM="Rhodosorus marinus" /LENGTH=430 /DNA_ID=CAMNT_0000972561 /DNA_START=345 /DNA_END=1637 /DNA_ORIENTATION=- /assembly_acc=CAM_ASM_000156